ncbi:MAG: hypothetical protein ABH971_02370 [bacterium]
MSNTNNPAFNTLLNNIITNIVNPIIYLLMVLSVIYFIWGIMVFIKNADNADKRKEGYLHMLWGIIGIFIMISARGIIHIIISSMGL